jgi:hypothetical protein
VTTLVPNSQLTPYFRPTDVMVDPTSGLLFFPLQLRMWPVSGFICNVPTGGGAMSVSQYSPPGAYRLAKTAKNIYWTATRTVASLSLSNSAPFGISATWSHGGGIAAGSNYVVWTDSETGRIYRVDE